jgi:hypothetical protein
MALIWKATYPNYADAFASQPKCVPSPSGTQTFGKLLSFALNGDGYAQPLYISLTAPIASRASRKASCGGRGCRYWAAIGEIIGATDHRRRDDGERCGFGECLGIAPGLHDGPREQRHEAVADLRRRPCARQRNAVLAASASCCIVTAGASNASTRIPNMTEN